MKKLIAALFFVFNLSISAFCQDSIQSPSIDNYHVQLNLPENWDIVRRTEGKDLTLSGYSPDQKLFVYYCQFMEDNKSRPKRYMETYAAQFDLNKEELQTRNVEIDGKKAKFYFIKDEAYFLGEKFKILFFSTSVNNKNIIAYLIYPLNSDEEMEQKVNDIMLYE